MKIDISDILSILVEAIVVFTMYNSFFEKKENYPKWSYGIGILILALLIGISNSVFEFGTLNVIVMILLSFSVSFMYKGKFGYKAVTAIFSYLIMSIMEIIVLYAITIAYRITVSDIMDNQSYILLGTIVSKAMALIVVNVVRLHSKRNEVCMSTSYWLLAFIMFVVSTATVFLIFRMSYDIGKAYMYNVSIICSVGLLFSTFAAMYLYERMAVQTQVIERQRQNESNLRMQLSHLDEIIVTQNQLRKFRHDIVNHEIALRAWLNEGNCEKALEYLDGLSKNLSSDKGTIKTGNTALDAIMSTKKAIAEKKNITFETELFIPENLDVEPMDLCVIFGNALDNAIEACDRVENEERQIYVYMMYSPQELTCRISNTAKKPEHEIIKTSKSDKLNHGFGLENIKKTVEKYNGVVNIEQDEEKFTLSFSLVTK